MCTFSGAIPPDPVDCIDRTVEISGSEPVELDLPQFFTYSGSAAKVTCDVNEVHETSTILRTCVAEDSELETTTTCQYHVNARGMLLNNKFM